MDQLVNMPSQDVSVEANCFKHGIEMMTRIFLAFLLPFIN